MRGRHVLSTLVVIAAVATLVAGFARGVDLGPGDSSLQAAAKSEHERHGQSQARRGAAHRAHAADGEATPPAALDNGRYAIKLSEQVVRGGTRGFGLTITDVRTGRPGTR